VAGAVAGVADALDYAHRGGVIHRDVKPSNLLLSPTGRLSVNDFGLARLLEEPGMTVTGEMVGTPMYMSPEQITAGRIPVDHRTDIYSLGATLYELLTLDPPFRGEFRDQLLAQIIQKEPRPPRGVNSTVPVDLETICLKAMEKDPDRRYQTAGQMAEDLRRYVNRFAILARRTGPVGRLWKWVRRNPALAASLAGVLVCAAVASGLAYSNHLAEGRRAEEKARHDAELLEEKRRAAMDKAILAARLEDFDEARKAIREAEKLNCSPGQIRMLQGQLELYHGNFTGAIEHLTQATKLLPDSVAAWSMLAVAYINANRNTEAIRALDEALRLPAVTPEDYLFRGHAQCTLDPEGGLRTLNEAIRRRPSTLARLIRLDALQYALLDVPDRETAKLAGEESAAIRRQYPDNPGVAFLSMFVQTSRYKAGQALRDENLQKDAVRVGSRDAQFLKDQYPHSPDFVVGRWRHMTEIGRGDEVLPELQQVWKKSPSPNTASYLGIALYLKGEFSEAAKVFGSCEDDVQVALLRVMALAADSSPDAPVARERLLKNLAGRKLTEWDLFNYQLILRFLGRKAEAVEIAGKFLEEPGKFPPLRKEPFRRALQYCAGERAAKSLIDAARGHRADLCNAYLCIALTAIADGYRASAWQNLKLCAGTGYYQFIPYDIGRMLLVRMAKDPAWPRWIKSAP
jgi:tetratricopeptide (TPR) repeat protein